MPFEFTHAKHLGFAANDLTFGPDHRLWFRFVRDDSVFSADPAECEPIEHFKEENSFSYAFDGNAGVVGTADGRVMMFTPESPTLRLVTYSDYPLHRPLHTRRRDEARPGVDAVGIDSQSRSIFYVANGAYHRVSFDGKKLGKWRCKQFPFVINFSGVTQRLFSAMESVEIVDIATGSSSIYDPKRLCPYVNIAFAPDGTAAVFGGDIDIFDGDGALITSITNGDYNGGTFDASGRLIVREVTRKYPADVTITTRKAAGIEFDVVSPCQSFAVSPSGNEIVVSSRLMLHFFRKLS